MKLTARLVHGAVFCAALISLTSFGATPTAVWQGSDLADGNTKNGMTLKLNGNTSAGGVVTIGSSSVYIETGMTSSTPHAGLEATVVLTVENVNTSLYSGLFTMTDAFQSDSVGVESYCSYGNASYLYWVKGGGYMSGTSQFMTYPTDHASHKVALGYAASMSGSGGYGGCAVAFDGSYISGNATVINAGYCITRINVGGYQDSQLPLTGARITRIAVYNSALSTADLAKATSEEEPEPEEEVVWGNVGNASTAGVATTVQKKTYSSFNVDFGATDNISQKAIGNDGSVKITKVRLFVEDGVTTKPSTITISQGDTVVTSDSCSFVASQKIYGAYWPTTTSHYWTRKAIDATFASETQFDTTKPITISFDETTLCGIQPANSVCVGSDYTPAIEITGVYDALPDTPIYTWNQFCENTAYTATPLAKQVTAGKQIMLAFKGTFAESDLYGARILFYSGDSNDIYLATDSDGYVVLTLNRKTSKDSYSATSDVVLTAGAHQFGMLVRRGANGSGHTVSIIVTMDGKELVRLGDGSLTFDTNPMKSIYFGDSTKANNSYTAYYVEPENGVDDDVTTVANLITDVKVLFKERKPEPMESVSINIIGARSNAAGKSIDDNMTAGVFEVAGAQWNQIVGVSGAITEKGIALKQLEKDGTLTDSFMVADVRAATCYTAGVTPVNGDAQMMYGYLDDGETDGSGYGAQLTIRNIPYSEYTVHVYMGTDGTSSSASFTPVTVIAGGVTNVHGTASGWGSAASTHGTVTLTEDSNYFTCTGLSGGTLEIKGGKKNGSKRCGIAGIQIVNTGTMPTGPIITKDEANHTWVVDTTYGEYEFTSADITALKNTAWAVTLKSLNELGATIDFGNPTQPQKSHFVFESGVHYLTWKGNAQNMNFTTDGTGEDPSILVKSGAVLNFTAKDITGWEGAAANKMGNVIRVNEGGVVNLLQDGENTHYYQGRYCLDPGATLTATYSGDKFRLNGGAVEGSEQLYVPNTTNGAPAATLFAANGLRLASDTTAGLGVFVGTNATLEVDADISSDGAQPLTKWGAGTLAIVGSLTNYTGALTVNAGALKLPQETTLGGSLTLAANTVLDIAYDGLPPEGTVLLTAADGITTNDAVVVKVNGEKCGYTIVDNAIVFDYVVVVVPEMNFTYEPKVGASPEGWLTDFSGEKFTAAGQFRVGPDGECVSVVTTDPSRQHPYAGLASKANYTMALYADISQLSYDKTGRYMLDLGSKGSGINQGILMTKDGNIQLYQANKTTVQYTLTTTNPPAAGYHLFVWTQSTANGGALYVDGERVGTIPAMTSATSAGFQIGNMHGGAWDGNYAQGIGMAVAGVYGWGQVLSPAQVALLAEYYPAVPGGITVKSVDPNITGTLNLVYGNTITSGVYNCSIAVAYGATIDIAYEGEVKEGAQLLRATSISADAVTFTINGQPLPSGLDMDAVDGKLVVCKQKVTKLLNPLAVKEGDDLKVSCNEEAAEGAAAKAYDGNLSTYFAPGSAANALGVSWTGIEFTNGVIVTRIAYVSNKEKRVIGGAFQGANKPDFSDAENIHVVMEYTSGGVDVTLDEAKGPYKYLRFMGMYGGDIKEIAYYGLADSGAYAPTKAPTITGTSSNGVARIAVTADETIPQLFVVQRAMRNFCDPDGSDYETCVTLAPQLGETMNWTDRKPTGYAMYRARGFNANGSSDWTYFEIEPEKLINGPAAPKFGEDGKPGFYADQAVVTIDYDYPGATIYYTTDGSTPTTNSTPYTGAITLVDVCESVTNDLVNIRPNPVEVTDKGYKWIKPTADQPNVNVIRARAFLPDGSASSNDVAGTWMVGPTANAHKLRVISIQTDRDNYFSDPTGILVPGDVYKQKGWGGGTVGSPNANYFQHGDDWERPAQIEIFDTDRTEMLAAPMGTRIRGNWSRAAAKKSLTCYFRKEYGVKNAKIKLFNDEKKMKFKRFILRNGGNDWYKFGYRDAIGQSIFRGYVSTGTQGFEPGLLYINGEYWGCYNLRHCYSKHHFEEWNGSVGDDIDYVKMSPDDGNHFEVQEGDLCAMWNIMQYMITRTDDDGVMDDDEYAYVASQIDIADMIDYYIVNIFLGNGDWNGNNMGYWRNRHGDDQKWHFTVYDCDSAMSFGSDTYGADYIKVALNANDTDESATRMVPGFFKRCFKNEGFRKRFANRYADLLNTALTAERATNVVAEVAAKVSHELPRNIDRWPNIGSGANWSNELATVTKFFYKRPSYARQHILSHCSTGAVVSVTLAENEGNGTVKLNTIESGKEFELPFTGQYFSDISITLTATPESGSGFAGWKIGDEVISTEPTMTLTPTNGVTIQAVFQAGGVNPQQTLRLVEIYGSTNTELHPGGDEGEFVIITNTSAQAVDLTGMSLESYNRKKSEVTLTAQLTGGSVGAYGTYKLEQAALWADQKISNGKIRMTLTDSDGVEIQVGITEFTGDADEKGASMVADNLDNPCEAWHVGPIHDPSPTPPPGPGGEYTLSGKLTNDVTFTSSSNVVVTLNNVTSENYKLTLEGEGVFTIYYPEGTTNSFTMKNNAAALIATNAAGVVITGPGVGNFKSTKKIADFGIIAAKNLTVEGGTTTVTFDQDKPTTSCIYLTGNYWQKGGTMNVVMPRVNTTNEFNGVLLYNKKTYAKIDGGAFNATVGGTKSNAIKLKGSCNGYFNGGTMTASLIGPQARVTNGGTQTFTDGSYVVTMPEDYASLTNARVFKVDKALTISGGTFDITVPSEGSEAFATEEELMTISGGTFRVLTGNDCVSAEVGFKMTGGTFYGTSTGNDVIDSNADIEITGGLLLAYTTAVEEDGYGSLGLDVNIGHALTISGGTVVALGGPNAKWPDGCDFQQPGYTNVELDALAYSEKYLVLEGEKTKTTARLPKITKQTFALLVSAPTLKGPATTTETEPKVAPVAEGIPLWIESVGDDVITGDYPDGTNIVLTAAKTVKIGNATFGKALTFEGEFPVTIELQPDTTAKIPTIAAGANALTVDGAGTLAMSNATTLITCGDLIVTNGTMNLVFNGPTAKDKAIVLTGDFKQYGGAISMTLASDVQVFGIYSNTKDKMAYIYGGTFDAVVAGGEKSAAIKMNKGSSDITIEGGTITATMSGAAPRFANTDGNIKIKGGTIEVSTVEGLGANANVFSAKKGLKISGGVITGEATGEGSEVFSADEAIEIKDGVISVESADDCFSAASIAITGGKVQGLSTGGDAIDAKADVTIEGGYVFATTCFTNGYGIAADGAFTISGGNVVAVGAPGFIQAPDEGSIACYTNASIAKLKKYLELTSDYIDHTEKLSVNLKEGEKRCKDGLSLVAVVPNMYGTYTDTKDKPTDVDPKHAKKLDPNLDGVFVTTVEKEQPSIVPGSTSTSFETEEEAATAAKLTTVSRPAEVAQSGAITEEAYADLFDVKAVQTATSTWELVPELKPTVSNDVQTAANEAVTSETLVGTMTTAEPTAKVKTQAGLFYGLAASEALNDVGTVDLPFAKWVLGTGGEQQLKADKPGESSGFYQIRVQIAPPKP